MLAVSDHPFSDLRVDPEGWLGPTVVSGENQVLQRRLMFNRWFIDHQQRGVVIGDNVITLMLNKSSAQALRLGGLLYRVR